MAEISLMEKTRWIENREGYSEQDVSTWAMQLSGT